MKEIIMYDKERNTLSKEKQEYACLLLRLRELNELHNNYDVSTQTEESYYRSLRTDVESFNRRYNRRVNLQNYKGRYYL